MKIYNIQKRNITINYCCKICGTAISKDSALYGKGMCRKCYFNLLKIPSNNNMYGKKHSIYTKQKISLKRKKSKIIKCCIDCNKELKSRKTIRCQKCHSLYYSGKNHPCYKDGRSIIIYKCINCQKIISRGSLRCKSCANKGKHNPNFRTEIKGYYNYMFSDTLKSEIKCRDYFMCQYCGLDMNSSFWQCGVNLQIHHIDYNKLNCKKDNLITLCCSCHMKSNYNRDFWYAYYTYLINLNSIERAKYGKI